ncbi:MAG: DUF4831 family protein [Bacteroidales bacterium]
MKRIILMTCLSIISLQLAIAQVTYYLPRTVISVKVEVEGEIFTAGPYARYADKYLGIKNAGLYNSQTWKIAKIELSSYNEADATVAYSSPSGIPISLASNGCLSGVNDSYTGEVIYNNNVTSDFSVTDNITYESFTNLSLEPFFQKGDSTTSYKTVSKSEEQKAYEASRAILEARTKGWQTWISDSGDLPTDGEAYKTVAKELQKFESDYTALFVGKSKTVKRVYTFSYAPDAEGSKDQVLFRFSNERGVLDSKNISGDPVSISITKTNSVSDSNNNSTSGIFYRIPGSGNVSIAKLGSIIAKASMQILQLGNTIELPGTMLTGGYKLRFNPNTGSLDKSERVASFTDDKRK